MRYYTLKNQVPLRRGQKVGFTPKKGYYAKGKALGKVIVNHPKPVPKPVPKPLPAPPSPGKRHRLAVVSAARSLVGIRETPPHSNSGPSVHIIQSSTGAYNAPWCVSTIQYIWKKAGLGTWANDTAGAYYLAEYAREHGCLIAHPMVGCAVVYHIGQGHAGTVTHVHADGTFDAIEGNEEDAVRLMPRNPKHIYCQFILRPELRG